MTQEDFDEAVKYAKEHNLAPSSLPFCGGACSECKYRAEEWAKYLDISVEEVWDLSM